MPIVPKAPNDPEISIQSGASDASIDSLDFERTDRSAGVCAQCTTPITDRYYTIGSHVLCESCHLAFRNAKDPGNAASRSFGAAALGTVAAAIGCALWMLVTQLTGYEIGLIAIAVGYIVGIAVHVGARRVGGLFYQLLAVFLTYTAIVMTYVPMIANQLMASEDFQREANTAHSESWTEEGSPGRAAEPVEGESPDVPVKNTDESVVLAWIAAVPFAYAIPFLMGFENIIGILIIGFALWQAFRMNARVKIELQGPFRLEVRDPAVG
jgi:hypothetical protein